MSCESRVKRHAAARAAMSSAAAASLIQRDRFNGRRTGRSGNFRTMRPSLLLAFTLLVSGSALATPRMEDIRLPPGFRISVYAEGMPQARSLALGAKGTLFVGSSDDKVYAVPPGGGKARVVASRLEAPHGVAFKDGALYVAEIGRILRYDNIEEQLDHPPKPAVVVDDLPTERHHGLKPIRFGPD